MNDPRPTDCLDTDSLVDLALALGRHPAHRLDHLLECGSCQALLATAATVRQAHAAPAAARTDPDLLAARVLESLPLEDAGPAAARPWIAPLLVAANAATAALAGMAAALFLGTAPGAAGIGPAAALLMGLGAAAVVLAASFRRSSGASDQAAA